MITTEQIQDVVGQSLMTQDGTKIGKIGQVYLDDETGRPEWVTVSTGLFGTSESFVPIGDASFDGEDVVVPLSKDQVKGAPRIDADGSLSETEEDELYTYYGMAERGSAGADASGRDVTGQDMTGQEMAGEDMTGQQMTGQQMAGRDVAGDGGSGRHASGSGAGGGLSDRDATDGARTEDVRLGGVDDSATGGRTTDDGMRDDRMRSGGTTEGRMTDDRTADTGSGPGSGMDSGMDSGSGIGRDASGRDGTMTRSEERLDVGTRTRESGRARLRKHVVTEQQSVTVPVSHEELVVDRQPITDGDRNAAGGALEIGEEEHEVVLHEERPVVEKTVEAVERVSLGTQQVTEDTTVTEDVRTEQIDLDADAGVATGTRSRD